MKLIDEKEIDIAALDYAEKEKYCKSEFDSFKAGFSFSEQIITPLMIEFTEWCTKNHNRLFDGNWVVKVKGMDSSDYKNYTTRQLLKKFLKLSKNESKVIQN